MAIRLFVAGCGRICLSSPLLLIVRLPILAANRSTPHRLLFKGLILLAAAGVKIREGKSAAVARHAKRAAMLFRLVMRSPDRRFHTALGMPPGLLAEHAEAATTSSAVLPPTMMGQAEPVFGFILGHGPQRPSAGL